MLDRRYQIFISSTFRDLTEERAAVATAIQRINQLPAGMELFPSGNNAPWDVIAQVISASDYYVVIVGARYGSTDKDGLSWTEREYEFATSNEIPVLPFVHEDPSALASRTDQDNVASSRLENFVDKLCERHTVTRWSNADQLATQVVTGLISEILRNPRTGWVRGDLAADRGDLLKTLERVREENDKLREKVASLESNENNSPSDLILHGDQQIGIEVRVKTNNDEEEKPTWETVKCKATWLQLFQAISWESLLGAKRETLIKRVIRSLGVEGAIATDELAMWKRIATQFVAWDLLDVRNELRPQDYGPGMRAISFAARSPSTPSTMVNTEVWYLSEKGRRAYSLLNSLPTSGLFEVTESE